MRLRWAIPAGLALALVACGETRDEDVAGDPPAADTAQRAFPPEADAGADEPDVAAAPPESQPTSQAESDLEITRKIREKLVAEDAPLSDQAQNVTVVAKDGVVTLSGRVEGEEEKDRVLEIVRATEGVRDVDDRIEISEP
jgi:osmotically-inducible protein OsmY